MVVVWLVVDSISFQRSKGREEEDRYREYDYIVERRAGGKGKSYRRVVGVMLNEMIQN